MPHTADADKAVIQLARLCKALGHPARIRIVQELHQRQSCIGCDLVDHLGLAQSTTSEHLRILKQAGVIHGEIEHPRICYRLNPKAVQLLQHWLAGMREPVAAATAPGRPASAAASAAPAGR